MIADRELWQRARPLFDELVDLEPAIRLARLEAIGATDSQLREAVEWLLSADINAEKALLDYQFGARRDTSTNSANVRDPLGIVGLTISHFRVTGFLASGGMGAVYTAEDVSLGRTVALKFPLPHQSVDRAVRERFINEARSVASLDHPNLCAVLEIGDSEHGVFIAMPLYSGETLKDRLAREGALLPKEAIEILLQVTAGLASAHAAGIVHRDLKPANVMLLSDGTVKVLDFGLAKIRDVSLTKSHMTLGTIGYIAPEQIRNGMVDARTDLWAIGVLLYEMLTGTTPFRGEHELSILHAVLHDVPRRASELKQRLSPELDALIGALLEKLPDDRYQSADSLLADLAALQRGAPLAFRTPFWRRSRRHRQVRKVLFPLAALLFATLAGASWSLYKLNAPASQPASTVVAGVRDLQWTDNVAEIGTATELASALVPSNAGRHVRLRAGTYAIEQPLVVPDGMTLEGAGRMQFEANGRPTGFSESTRTTLRMIAGVGGDMLTLGNDASIRNLEIADLVGRSGNVVAVVSRQAGDSIAATIFQSVIVNPNALSVAAGGPLGRALAVITRNLNLAADPPPDHGSVLSVRITESVIQSPVGGGGFFAYNFAANSRITLDISGSVIGGSNEANGGVSRPESVHHSEVRLESRGNLYRNEWADPCASALLGWNLTGGSGAPFPFAIEETRENSLRVRSTDDRIEGFTTGIYATGSRRFFGLPLSPPPTANRIDLQLIGTVISTPSCTDVGSSANTMGVPAAWLRQVADIRLTGAWAENAALTPGDRNVLRAELRGVTGSGQRANGYLHTGGAGRELSPQFRGTGNLLQVVEDRETFLRSNRGLNPAPASVFFGTPR